MFLAFFIVFLLFSRVYVCVFYCVLCVLFYANNNINVLLFCVESVLVYKIICR